MPRPKSPDGKNENVCIKVSPLLLAEIDAARGRQSRSDWGRDAFIAALGAKEPARGRRAKAPEAPPTMPSAGPPPRPRKAGTDCPHRLPPGAYCKACGRSKA